MKNALFRKTVIFVYIQNVESDSSSAFELDYDNDDETFDSSSNEDDDNFRKYLPLFLTSFL